MNGKKVNWSFFIAICIYITLALGAGMIPVMSTNLIVNNVVCEAAIVLPGLLFAILSREKLAEFLHFKKIKLTTLAVLIPFTLLTLPAITLLNLLSQLLVKNQVVMTMESYEITKLPLPLLLLSVGAFGPFCEEVAFRGICYRGYARKGGRFGAVILSALLFGLFHMNLNQAVYAFGVGLIAALAVEATDSLWSSVVFHGLINSGETLMLYLLLKVDPHIYSDNADMLGKNTIIMSISAYLILAAITLPIAWALLVWMSENEGRRGVLSAVWNDRKKKEDKLITVPLLLAIILCIGVMILGMI